MKISIAVLLSIIFFSTTWTQAQTPYPPIYTPVCNDPYKIVIIGSSTAYGSGATPIDSSWARKLSGYINLQNGQSSIVNLGQPGFTSYHVMPTGYVPPPTRPFPVDTTHNITKALQLKPNAIIINLPSNDIGLGVPVAEVKANFDLMVAKADSAKVPVWVTTTQPRNNLSPSEKLMQVELKDWVLQRYGSKAIDFWTDIANPDHTINPFYSANDNVHVNNAGHHLFFTRVVAEKIWDSICLRRNGNPGNTRPVAVAGNDISITGNSANVQLNGSGSYDPEGGPLTYRWNIISGTGGAINNSQIVNPIFTSSTTGQYRIVLTVTDNAQLTGTDTLMISITAANILPVANAGADKLIHLPPNTTTLNGSNSFDSDGAIVGWKWRKITGPSMVFSNDAIASPSVNSLTYGVYSFELMVTDNKGATAKDTMVLTVNNPPVANAGMDKLITLPPNTTTLNGSASSDIDGTITTWKWRKVTGPTLIFSNDAIASPSVNSLTNGVYTLELMVTDNRGATAKDTMVLTVNNPAVPVNNPPVANAGIDKLISLPPNTTPLDGSASFDSDGSIAAWKWRKITGPSMVFSNDAIANPSANSLTYGVYGFELLVTDNNGATAKDTMVLTVNNPPVANAGPDAGITLPTNTVTLSGVASTDVDGAITSYSWRQVSGATAAITSTSTVQTIVTFTTADTYRFELTVTDNRGRSAKDSVDILVSPALVTSAPQSSLQSEPLVLYPNPGTNIVYLNLPDAVIGQYRLDLVNLNGQTVMQKTGTKRNTGAVYTDNINIRDLPKGIYLIKLWNKNKSISSTIIKL